MSALFQNKKNQVPESRFGMAPTVQVVDIIMQKFVVGPLFADHANSFIRQSSTLRPVGGD